MRVISDEEMILRMGKGAAMFFLILIPLIFTLTQIHRYIQYKYPNGDDMPIQCVEETKNDG